MPRCVRDVIEPAVYPEVTPSMRQRLVEVLKRAVLLCGLGLAASFGLSPSLADGPREIDPLPPVVPDRPAPLDWAEWQRVPKLLGVSRVQTDWIYSHSYDGGYDRASGQKHATVFMEWTLVDTPTLAKTRLWKVSDAVGTGGESSQRSTGSSTISTESSEQGTYSGPFSLRTEPTLSLKLDNGVVTFLTLDEPAGSWTLRRSTRFDDRLQGIRDVSGSVEGGSVDGAWLTNVAPKRVGPFSIQWDTTSTSASGTVAGEPGAHTTQRSAFLQIWPDWSDVELVVRLENIKHPEKPFEQWRPLGNLEFPTRPGPEPLRVRAILRPKVKNPTAEQLAALPEVRRFRFELSDTSREPGVCLNWPLRAVSDDSPPAEKDSEYDLRFAATLPEAMVLSPRQQKAGVKRLPNPDSGLPEAWVELDCYDFGAHARLQVIAELADEREVVGYREVDGRKVYLINLPDRQEGSFIAEHWRKERQTTDPDGADLDDEPLGDGQKGDGFSTYEEYRGFRVAGAHVSTHPAGKDLFVRSGLDGLEAPGCRLLETQTVEGNRRGLKIWERVSAGEMPESRIMNGNRSASSPQSSSEYQHGLILMPASANGRLSISGTPGLDQGRLRPKFASPIRIDIDDEDNDLKSSVAHEISHAIGVRHHGETDLRFVRWDRLVTVRSDGSLQHEFTEQRLDLNFNTGALSPKGQPYKIRVFQEGNPVPIIPAYTNWAFVLPREIYVAVRGGEHSGRESCLMRYRLAGAYIPGTASSNDRILTPESTSHSIPLEDNGQGQFVVRRVCVTCSGNGMNPARYGNATFGDCLHQYCVRDSAPYKNPYSGRCSVGTEAASGGPP